MTCCMLALCTGDLFHLPPERGEFAVDCDKKFLQVLDQGALGI